MRVIIFSMSFLALCYHYIKNTSSIGRFPRIYGNTEDQLRAHTFLFKNTYHPLSLDEIREIYSGDTKIESKKTGVLLTFDDGLAGHYNAARILAEAGVKGVFFIPTCIFEDKLPANPQIIHYSIAHHGIGKFLETLRLISKEVGFETPQDMTFQSGDNPAEVIARIKKLFKYELPHKIARKVLIRIYEELLLSEFPNILNEIHLTKEQVSEIVGMGHSIGTHSHTHVSVATANLSEEDFVKEVIAPKKYLEETFATTVDAFSYPFGGAQDRFTPTFLQESTQYRLAFTVDPIVNTPNNSPFEIGRYEPMPWDDAPTLKQNLAKLEAQ